MNLGVARKAVPPLVILIGVSLLGCTERVNPDEGPLPLTPSTAASLPQGAESLDVEACIRTMDRGQVMPDFGGLAELRPPIDKADRRKILDEFNASSGAIQRTIQCVERFGPLPGGDVLLAQDSSMMHTLSLISGDEEANSIALVGMSYLTERYPESCYVAAADTFVESAGATLDTDVLVRDCFPGGP